MSLSPIISRDIVNTRLLLNAIKREKYMDTLRDAVVGDYKWSACNSSYNGWMICNGAALDRVTYSALYDVIGTTYGSNNTSDFKLPDCRGRIIAAPGTPYLGANTLSFGNSFGSQTHTLIIPEMPSHTHTGTTSNSFTGITADVNTGNGSTANTSVYNGLGSQSVEVDSTGDKTVNINDPSHNHLFTTNYRGGNDTTPDGNCSPHDIQNPTIVIGNVFLYSGILEPYVPTVDIIGPNDNTYEA